MLLLLLLGSVFITIAVTIPTITMNLPKTSPTKSKHFPTFPRGSPPTPASSSSSMLLYDYCSHCVAINSTSPSTGKQLAFISTPVVSSVSSSTNISPPFPWDHLLSPINFQGVSTPDLALKTSIEDRVHKKLEGSST